ncbi:MAG: hypothetical protein HA496_01750 [Thaumarchaeota archaeon]|nr:hypothetical protein [Nitrososphaerota archaeon]
MDYLPATLKSIKLDNLGCPKIIEEKMKELTLDGEPINRIIIDILDKEESLSQTELCEMVEKRGVSLSRTRIIAYVDELAKHNLLKVEPPEKKTRS